MALWFIIASMPFAMGVLLSGTAPGRQRDQNMRRFICEVKAMAKRYGSTYALKMDELIDDIGAKLEENDTTEQQTEEQSYADKIRASVKATGAAAYPHLVLKKMVEDAKEQSASASVQDEGEASNGKRYGSTTAKRLDDWIALTAGKLKSSSATAEMLADDGESGSLEEQARERQQAHAYGTTEYQRRVWFDMVDNAEGTSSSAQQAVS